MKEDQGTAVKIPMDSIVYLSVSLIKCAVMFHKYNGRRGNMQTMPPHRPLSPNVEAVVTSEI